MNLVADAGNSWVKLAVFKSRELIIDKRVPLHQFEEASLALLKKHPAVTHAIIASVSFLNDLQLTTLSANCELLIVDHHLKLPFKNVYASPETLGADRIALAAAAVLHFPEQNTLVIDAGTCITYDMITQKGEYLGGAISPGLQMRYQALNYFTDGLPLLETGEFQDFIGNNTENSIHSGVINGLCLEIEGVIDQYQSRYKFLTVILTGGDAQFLSKRLKKAIFAHSNFLLEGLNFLLEYNKR